MAFHRYTYYKSLYINEIKTHTIFSKTRTSFLENTYTFSKIHVRVFQKTRWRENRKL